jgi:putative phage-type endonuclease
MASKQGTEAWLAERVGKVTGSRVGTILGLNPHQSPSDVMREMVREAKGAEREFKGNAATKYGQEHEDYGRRYLEVNKGYKVDEAGFITHPEHKFLGASPDGLVGFDGCIEIKTPYYAKNVYTLKDKPYYEAQCRLVMEVTGTDWCDFVCWMSDDNAHVERLERDPKWIESVLPKLKAFHEDYLRIVADEELCKPFLDSENKVAFIANDSMLRLATLAAQLKKLDEASAPIRKEFDELKQKVGTEHGSCTNGAVKISRIERKGSVDYKAVFEELNLNELLESKGRTLDSYRKKATVAYQVEILE